MSEDNECTPPLSVEMIADILEIAKRHRLAMDGIAAANDNALARRQAPSPLSAEARGIPLAEVVAWLENPRTAGAVRVPGESS